MSLEDDYRKLKEENERLREALREIYQCGSRRQAERIAYAVLGEEEEEYKEFYHAAEQALTNEEIARVENLIEIRKLKEEIEHPNG